MFCYAFFPLTTQEKIQCTLFIYEYVFKYLCYNIYFLQMLTVQ